MIAGTGSNDYAYAIDLSQYACEVGADALLHVTPYYNKASQEGLVKYFSKIADNVTKPVILYNVPSRTGCAIGIDAYKELAEHPRIVAAKEACGDISFIVKLCRAVGDKMDIYSGNDDQIVPLMSVGAKGVISVLSNVAPAVTAEMTRACLEGDFKRGGVSRSHKRAVHDGQPDTRKGRHVDARVLHGRAPSAALYDVGCGKRKNEKDA